MIPRAPLAITSLVRSFCRRVAATSAPLYLETRPIPGAAHDDCFGVAERQVARAGGERVLGWQIWELPGILIEAEFHAVWRDPRGELHDITPKADSISRILFLPDPSRVYEKRQVNNIRQPLSNTFEVRELIAAADARFEFMDRGERAHQHGLIALRGRDRDEWRALLERSETASLEVMRAMAEPPEETAPPSRVQPADAKSRNQRKRARRSQR